MSLLLSIPSPSSAWQSFDVTDWLHNTFGSNFSFDLQIHTYAICILIGIVLAVLMTNARLSRRGAERWVVVDLAIWSVVGGVIGGRAFQVATNPNDYFGDGKNVLDVFAVWQGGLAVFGALVVGAVGAYLGCRQTGIRFGVFLDALTPGLIIALVFGRLGNYFNVELFGTPTNLPWGLQVPTSNAAYPTGLPAGTLFNPTFAYEIVWNLFALAIILLLNRSMKLEWGKTFALFLVLYGVGRIWFESIGVEYSQTFLGVRTNVWAAFLTVGVGVLVLVMQSRRHTGLVPSAYVEGRGPDATADRPADTDETDHAEVDSRDGADFADDTQTSPATARA